MAKFAPAKHWSETPLAAVLSPLRAFVEHSATGGVLLFAATVLALWLANGPYSEAYLHLLHLPLGLAIGDHLWSYSLLHWVNDGLMTLFFFLVGLEIKREFLTGELSNRRAALLPMVAAAGGALTPALIYLAFNHGTSHQSGWAVPMATDIAFALGALSVLQSRVPMTLKIFLTALAIVDDLMAVLVIALFYSSQLNFVALGAALAVLLLLLACNLFGIRNLTTYALGGVVVWLAFLQSGVHSTVAGVLVAWTLPARSRMDAATFQAEVKDLLSSLDAPQAELQHDLKQGTAIQLERLSEAVQSPLGRAEDAITRLVSLLIVPVFALANAAVPFSADFLDPSRRGLGLGIVIGLCLGKPLGILLACWITVRVGWADLPGGASWGQMLGVGVLGGIGFTMSVFIASLAFPDPQTLNVAKTQIMLASALATVLGLLWLWRVSPEPA
jgi:Na+:H+ antiporter, NhaA family